MPTKDEIDQQRRRIETYRVTLSHYLHQISQIGSAYMPPSVAHGINEARAGIAGCKAILYSWGIAIEDHPDDEERSQSVVSVPTGRKVHHNKTTVSWGPAVNAHDFDPQQFIDREFEQELFENLLELGENARILAIRDSGGMGKTQLLAKLQYRCRITRPRRIPVCLLSLDDFPGDAILPVIQAMEQQLTAFGLEFANFRRLENARLSADFMSIRSSSYLEGAFLTEFSDIRIAGAIVSTERVERMSVGLNHNDLTPEQESVAQDVIIKAFYHDLRKHCEQGPVVILLDAYEKCSRGIRQWLEHDMLERLVFDQDHRPAALVLVIAGREVPKFHQRWSIEDCNQMVCTVQQLGRWERHHIEECLRVHGFAYEAADIDSFYRLVEIGIPPSQIVQLIRTAVSVRER